MSDSSPGVAGRNVSRNVERLRNQRGLSFVDLAELLKQEGRPIPVLGLRRIEKGERRVDVDDMAALAAVFGVAEPWDLAGNACETCLNAPPAGFECTVCKRRGAGR